MKLILTIAIILFTCVTVFGQPTAEENFTKVNLVFLNCHMDTLRFTRVDSETFVSKNKEYEIAFLVYNLEDQKGADVTDNVWLTKDAHFIAKYSSSLDLIPKDNVLDRMQDLVIRMQKGKEEMVVYFKLYRAAEIAMPIMFKKGTYKVEDPENPVLVKISD